jgi:TolA-binding protein
MNMRRPQATIALFDRIINEYPDYEKSPSALFLKAFVYEDQLQDLENAKHYYELFLEKYPESEFADDAEVSLQNLGKSPEELIREFEEKGSE